MPLIRSMGIFSSGSDFGYPDLPVSSSLCADLQPWLFPDRSTAGDRQPSTCLGHGFVELESPLFWTVLFSTARGHVLSDGMDVILVDLLYANQSSSVPVMLFNRLEGRGRGMQAIPLGSPFTVGMDLQSAIDLDLLLKWLCVTQIMGPRSRLSTNAVTDGDDRVYGLHLNFNSAPGRVLGSHKSIRTSVTAGVQATLKIECPKMSSDLCYSPTEVSFRPSRVCKQVLGLVWVLCYRFWLVYREEF